MLPASDPAHLCLDLKTASSIETLWSDLTLVATYTCAALLWRVQLTPHDVHCLAQKSGYLIILAYRVSNTLSCLGI